MTRKVGRHDQDEVGPNVAMASQNDCSQLHACEICRLSARIGLKGGRTFAILK
jgi:hypothetical protein